MFWVILIVGLIISAIAVGLGIDFWALVGILVVLAIVAFIGFGLWVENEDKAKAKKNSPEENDKKEIKKFKLKEKLGKIILIGTLITVIVIIISGIFGSCGVLSGDNDKHGTADNEYDEVMEGYDWGDGYYYDSSDNTVKKTLW